MKVGCNVYDGTSKTHTELGERERERQQRAGYITNSEIRDAVKLLSDERVLDCHVTRVIVKGRSGEQDDE